jgi:hypothetical protein
MRMGSSYATDISNTIPVVLCSFSLARLLVQWLLPAVHFGSLRDGMLSVRSWTGSAREEAWSCGIKERTLGGVQLSPHLEDIGGTIHAMF